MDTDIKKILAERAVVINKTLEKWLPRKFSEDYIRFMLGEARYKYSIETMNKGITDPFWDYMDRGGKRWRPALFLLIYEAFGKNPDDALDFSVIPEFIHNSTIIHDDIEDMSKERRNKPALHLIFGEDITINLGDFLYFLPFLVIHKKKKSFDNEKIIKAYEICLQEMLRVASGQATDISWHKGWGNADNISEEEYLQMCVNKTGCLARMAGRLATMLAGRDDDEVEFVGKFTETIGVAFQIQDDILNIVGEDFTAGKGGAGEDITEGKRSLLVIHALQEANEKDRKRLLEILDMHTFDQKLRDEAIEILKKYRVVEYSKEKAKKMVQDAWNGIDKILPESDAKDKLKAFAYYLIEREI
jgi:geranylgeranyl diphosphate synthase type I